MGGEERRDEVTIWKYQLKMVDDQKIEMPLGSQILSVQVQHGEPCMWVAVRPDQPTVSRSIRIAGTGHHLPGWSANNFVGTFQLAGGQLVFHVFADLG